MCVIVMCLFISRIVSSRSAYTQPHTNTRTHVRVCDEWVVGYANIELNRSNHNPQKNEKETKITTSQTSSWPSTQRRTRDIQYIVLPMLGQLEWEKRNVKRRNCATTKIRNIIGFHFTVFVPHRESSLTEWILNWTKKKNINCVFVIEQNNK